MKTLQLTQEYDAIVDDELYKELRKYRWHAVVRHNGANVYAKNFGLGELHRYVMSLYGHNIEDRIIDHINGDGLDNRKENLRVIRNKRENTRNRKCKKSSKHSPYTGVSFRDHAKRWVAKIRIDEKHVYLGYFDTPEEAGMAYDRAVLYHFPKENTVLNFPDSQHEHDLSKPYERKYKKTKRGSPTKYRGVHTRPKGKFGASIGFGGRKNQKKVHLGVFSTAEAAAVQYDIAQIVLHRVWQKSLPLRYINFPGSVSGYHKVIFDGMFKFLRSKDAI